MGLKRQIADTANKSNRHLRRWRRCSPATNPSKCKEWSVKRPNKKRSRGSISAREVSRPYARYRKEVGHYFATRVRTDRLALFWSLREKRPGQCQTPGGAKDTRMI